MRRMGEKRTLTPNHTQAISEINESIKSLGLKPEDISQAKKDLSHYMPKEIFFDKFGNEKGWSILFAIYAPQIIGDYFKEERGTGDKSQNPRSRRLQFESYAGDCMDYVNTVFMGYHDDLDFFRGGVQNIAQPSSKDKFNRDAYDPTMKDSRKSECPHCKASFWSMSAGNGDPKYKMVNGRPLSEWRGSADQAPEHIRFNPSTGESVETGGYSYCGGRHKIYDVTSPNGAVDIEMAEKISGIGWDQLRQQDRIRTVAKEGGLRHYLVDENLPEVERLLGGKSAYMKFSDEWVFEEGSAIYRQCRHPITLKTPASVIHDRISRYTFNLSEKKSVGRSRKIKVYLCPKPGCCGVFRDVNDITSKKHDKDAEKALGEAIKRDVEKEKIKKEEKAEDLASGTTILDPDAPPVEEVAGKERTLKGGRIVDVQCEECGGWFNIDELPPDHISSQSWMKQQTSLNLETGGESGEGSKVEMIDNVGCRDIGFVEVEMAEIFDVFDKEIAEISRTLNVQGAEHAKEIMSDWTINGLNYREIAEKYLSDVYKLHYTECADCGYKENESPSPAPAQRVRYDQGLPIVLTQCPRRLTHPNHKVDLPSIASISPTPSSAPVQPTGNEELVAETDEMSTERPAEAVQKRTEADIAASIQDDDQRRRYLGTNLIYHGHSPSGDTTRLGVSYQVLDIERGIVQELSPSDPRSYQGDVEITLYVFQPAKRLIDAILNALKDNPKIRDRHEDALDILQEWAKRLGESSTRFAKVKSFCKPQKYIN